MAAQPNVVLFFTDQHRLSAVGCYGPTPCRTPHIDRLAAEGVRFRNAYTSCPVCSPARGTVMTGLFPHTHGIVSNVHNLGCNVSEIPDRPDLLSRRLETAGYSLGYTGKWHLGTDGDRHFMAPSTPSLPRTVGFEGQNFPGHGNGGHAYAEYQQYLAAGGWKHEVLPWDEPARQIWPTGVLAGPVESSVPYFLAEHTIALVDRFAERGRPFFVWHNNWGPHGPYYVPREYIELYRSVPIPPWPNFDWDSRSQPTMHQLKIHPRKEELSWADWATAVRYYYAFTTLIDEQIGRVIEHLRRRGLMERTHVIFTADHGETLGSHGGMTDKGWGHWDETHRIPWIHRLPDGRHAGEVREQLISLCDLYPTVCELAGAAYDPDVIHGKSLLPVVAGTADGWRDQVVVEFGGVNSIGATQRTLVWDHYKYGYNACTIDELYDTAADPAEVRNLIDEPAYAAVAHEGRRRLLSWMAETKDGAAYIFRQKCSRHHPEMAREPWRR